MGRVDHRLVLHRARSRDHHAGGAVLALDEGADLVGREARHGLRTAEDRAPERLARIGGLDEEVADEVVGHVLHGGDLLEDHAALALELRRIECRGGEDVAQHVERQPDVLAEHAGGVAGCHSTRCSPALMRAEYLDVLAMAGPCGLCLEGHSLRAGDLMYSPCSPLAQSRRTAASLTPSHGGDMDNWSSLGDDW